MYRIDLEQIHSISNAPVVVDDLDHARPPEALNKSSINLGRKADIWQIGVIFVQMLLGVENAALFEGVDELIKFYESSLPKPVVAFIKSTTMADPVKRPIISELLKNSMFSDNLENLYFFSLPKQSSALSKNAFEEKLKGEKSLSRYKSDFEEIQFLGKGAFGAVIKVRNKIDNRYYAVKRIKLDRRNSEENQKILREVTTLSRLHHDRIIRYYQAWIEGLGDEENQKKTNQDLQSTISDSMANVSFRDEEISSGFGSEVSERDWLNESNSGRNETLHSNSSLLDLAINHTGFSDSETTKSSPISRQASISSSSESYSSISLETNEETGTQTKSNGPFLYIQMEYCPNQTLRDFIDEGLLDMKEVWRLFRQLLEGINYIHSQGMIHRDLKPSNIFLDSNGDIKIGDFGLAVADVMAKNDNVELKQTTTSMSLTGAVGTPFYMSPEQEEMENARYSNKVDMYSIGIIFVELCCGNFSTTMERIEMLRAVRKAAITLPPLFNNSDFSKAKQIATSLLNHDPKVRFSCEELLNRADLLPPKLEDETIKDAIKSLTVPSGPHYKSLIGALFNSTFEAYKDFTYDLGNSTVQDPMLLAKISTLKDNLKKLFETHGAIEVQVPSLYPKTNILQSSRKFQFEDTIPGSQFEVIDADGLISQFPTTLSTPFARFAAHNRLSEIKRFVFDKVYQRNPAGGQPKQHLSAAFDILHPMNSSIEDQLILNAHCIKVANEAIVRNVSKNAQNHVSICISFLELVRLIGKHCGIEESRLKVFCELIYHTNGLTWSKRRNVLASLLNLNQSSIQNLSKFSKPITFDKLAFLLKQESGFPSIQGELKRLYEYLLSYGIEMSRVFIDPFFILDPQHYRTIAFQLLYQHDRKTAHTLLYGGRYDDLIGQFAYPRLNYVGAIGFQLDVTKVAMVMDNTEKFSLLDVVIYSSGSTEPIIDDKMDIACELWAADIKVRITYRYALLIGDKTDFISSPNPSPDMLMKVTKKLGVSWFLVVKEHLSKGQFGILKLRDVEKRQEIDVYRSELVETILRLKAERASESTSIPNYSEQLNVTQPSAYNSGMIKVFVFTGPFAKAKSVQKAQISERALKAFTPIFIALTPTKPIEILAHDLSKPLIDCLVGVMNDSEEIFRRAMEAFPGDREVGQRFRAHLRSLKENGEIFIPMYNYRDGHIDLVSLVKS